MVEVYAEREVVRRKEIRRKFTWISEIKRDRSLIEYILVNKVFKEG